ncbi:DUF488 family protein [Rhodococcus erythropolis]
MSGITVYTVGHSTHPIDEFIDLLQTYGIKKLIDVRTIAKSRHNPQFGEAALAASVRARKITYRRMKALGACVMYARTTSTVLGETPRSRVMRTTCRQTSSPTRSTLLVERGHNNDVAIMCAEAVPWRCHRSMIGDARHILDGDERVTRVAVELGDGQVVKFVASSDSHLDGVND